MNLRASLVLVAAVVVVAGATATTLAVQRGDDGPSTPTEAEARAALDTKFSQAQGGDPNVFCDDTDIPDMCKSQWERLGGQEGAPRTPPRIASSREQDGYRVLRVCGDDGRGQPYRTDFVVGKEDGKLAYVLPVFWNGATFSGVHSDDAKIDRAQALGDPTAECSS
jgi:hypothetical protein